LSLSGWIRYPDVFAADYNKPHFRQLKITDPKSRRDRAGGGNDDANDIIGTSVAASAERGRRSDVAG
jgi:hypothetical protein